PTVPPLFPYTTLFRSLRGDEVYYNGEAVDFAYRDYAVSDLIDLEREGVDVMPMRALFKQNRIISSITAELDQKSCWEILTDPQRSEEHTSELQSRENL